VFFGALSVTPGSRIATALSDRFMIWLHSRCNPAGLQRLFE
jgi:hypothetical protein